jgi:hypothetical protein
MNFRGDYATALRPKRKNNNGQKLAAVYYEEDRQQAMRIILGIIFLVSVVMCAVAGGHIDDPNHDWFEHHAANASG